MKRIQRRRKHLRVNSPVGASLLCIAALAIIALLYVGVKWVVVNAPILVAGAREAMLTETSTPLPTAEPVETPNPESAEPIVTPALLTPEPDETEEPPMTEMPEETMQPDDNVDAPLYGITIGIDPFRDKGSQYTAEADYNLDFANKLAAYLEARGATVVLTRDTSSKSFSDSTRASVIRNAGCDLAIRLLCNHITNKKTGGAYVQTLKKYEAFAQLVVDEYTEATGIEKRKDNGIEIKSVSFLDSTGCPTVQLIMGHWTNSAELKNLKDEEFQEKMMEGLYNALLKQVESDT